MSSQPSSSFRLYCLPPYPNHVSHLRPTKPPFLCMDPYDSDELILLEQGLYEDCPSPPSEKSKEGLVLSNVAIRLADPVVDSDLESQSTDCPG
ncbi:unnamed protein product [Cuscuta europaea]|uniref:Uncharacterized protein n=1 Tax=Cuscuta europaea TaxID=41803 RepID=A0A9P0ZR60_CUSEU|nr:unnamed protein product [Cuscuta europaea]